MSEWAIVAELAKAKKLDGGLLAQSVRGLPFLLEVGMQVHFVPPVLEAPRIAVVQSVAEEGERYLVHFEGVTSVEQAQALAGHFCLVERAALPEGFDAPAYSEFVGLEVYTADEELIGTVEAVEKNPAHPMLRIALGYSKQEQDASCHSERAKRVEESPKPIALVPLVEEFILEHSSRLVMNLPEGLLEL